MRYLKAAIIAILISSFAQGQTYELGLYAGGANFIGDVGSTTFISPNAAAIGLVAKWNRSSRHSFRFSAIWSQLDGDDTKSNESRRQSRGYTFENNVTEVSLGIEYTFWEFDMFKESNPSTPYLYTGLTYLGHNEFTLNTDDPVQVEASGGLAIPMVIGYKAVIKRNLILALEIGARYTFSDNLDGSAPENNLNETSGFGNLNNNDWYMFTGVTLTYAFGRKPCFCAF